MLDRADIIGARNILGQQHGFDAGDLAGGGRVALENPGARVRRANRPDFEKVFSGELVVGVNRLAGDVFVRALVRRWFCSSGRESAPIFKWRIGVTSAATESK